MMDIKTPLRDLINRLPDRNLRKIAREAKVPYWPLYEWAAGKVEKLDVDHANRLHEHLTGQKWEVKL